MTLTKILGKYSEWSSVVLRVVLGVILFWHGQAKILNLGGVTDAFTGMGLPVPGVLAVIAAVIETFGGAFLVLGLLTRLSALLVSLEFVVITALKIFMMGLPIVALKGGGSAELDVVILASAVSLLLAGSTKLSLEQKLFKKELV